jgi:hypothetical protein
MERTVSRFRVVRKWDRNSFLYYVQRRVCLIFWKDVPGFVWDKAGPAIEYAKNLSNSKNMGSDIIWWER